MNTMGFADTAEKHHITYDNKVEDAFMTRDRNSGELLAKFVNKDKLCLHQPSQRFLQQVQECEKKNKKKPVAASMANNVSAIKDNIEGFTKCEIDRAKEA